MVKQAYEFTQCPRLNDGNVQVSGGVISGLRS